MERGDRMPDTMLSTSDNPYDPFTQYDDWFQFDQRMGYNTPSFLARVVVTSDELSEVDQQLATEEAIDEIVRENVLGLYMKVTKNTEDSEEISVSA
jgi:hypothetical protein